MEWLPEQLKTIKNLSEIASIIYAQDRKDLLPTILELLYQEVQQVIDENCVVKDERQRT